MRDAFHDLVHGTGCLACGRAGRLLCGPCQDALPRPPGRGRLVRPDPCPPGLAPAAAAGEYAGELRALLLAHKEHGAYGLAAPLGQLLAVAVETLVPAPRAGREDGRDDPVVVLVPVPSRGSVVRARGHDPLRRMSVRAARSLVAGGRPAYVCRLLRDARPVDDQAGLDAGQRRANLHEALVVRPRARAALAARSGPVHVVVCDDVLTTGATAREAQRALEVAGVPVLGVATVAATRRRGTRGRTVREVPTEAEPYRIEDRPTNVSVWSAREPRPGPGAGTRGVGSDSRPR